MFSFFVCVFDVDLDKSNVIFERSDVTEAEKIVQPTWRKHHFPSNHFQTEKGWGEWTKI